MEYSLGAPLRRVWATSLELNESRARKTRDAAGVAFELGRGEGRFGRSRIPYRISRAENRLIPEGQLISIAPVPGTIMRSGMKAVLTVSHGPPVVGDWRTAPVHREAGTSSPVWIDFDPAPIASTADRTRSGWQAR